MIEFRPVKMPSDLAGVSNGKLGPTHLKTVFFPGYGYSSLHPLALRAWNMMVLALWAATKVTMSVTPGGAYRSFEAQYTLFFQRYDKVYIPGRNVLTNKRTYQGTTYYLKRGMMPAAAPGNSNHGWGLAEDAAIWNAGRFTGITTDPKVWNWLVDNALSFGFSWTGARPGTPGWEPHHLQYFCGDVLPKRVTDAEKYLGIAA
jgi:LAS superfamily LD-carboxypeptidase LdcB